MWLLNVLGMSRIESWFSSVSAFAAIAIFWVNVFGGIRKPKLWAGRRKRLRTTVGSVLLEDAISTTEISF
jgi:hypothetical protein